MARTFYSFIVAILVIAHRFVILALLRITVMARTFYTFIVAVLVIAHRFVILALRLWPPPLPTLLPANTEAAALVPVIIPAVCMPRPHPPIPRAPCLARMALVQRAGTTEATTAAYNVSFFPCLLQHG